MTRDDHELLSWFTFYIYCIGLFGYPGLPVWGFDEGVSEWEFFLGIRLKRRALSGEQPGVGLYDSELEEISMVGKSHCVVNLKVAEALLHAVSSEREAKY